MTTTAEPDTKLVLTINTIFRDTVHAHLMRLFAIKLGSVEERMLMFALTAETLSIAAYAHAGTRDEFLRMARDAYALAETGEFEQ